MKRIALTLLLSASAAHAADQPVLLPPRLNQPTPGAIETRPIWERPSFDGLTLQQRTEAALDRGNGRVEDQPTFELKQIGREQLGGTSVGSTWDRAQTARDEQVEQLRLKSEREGMRQQRIERESETLAAERRLWQTALARENAAGGAVIDRDALAAVERDYQAAMSAAGQKRADALAAAGNDREKRAAAQRNYESATAGAINARAQRRQLIFGAK